MLFKSFQIFLLVLACLSLQNCSSLRFVDLDASRDASEMVRGQNPENGRYYGREMKLSAQIIRERKPNLDEQGRYLVLFRNRSSRDLKLKLYKKSYQWLLFIPLPCHVEFFGAALHKGKEVERRVPVGDYLLAVYKGQELMTTQSYEISTATEYDSQTGNYYAKVIECYNN